MTTEIVKKDDKKEITATQGGFQTALQKVQSVYLKSVSDSLTTNNQEFDGEQKACVFSAIGKLHEVATGDGLRLADFDQSNITKVLSQVALLRLNTNAIPRECGFQIRRVFDKGVEVRKEFEFFVEGIGNDKLLRKFGENVLLVDIPFKVRRGDEFTFPTYNGRTIVPPTWKPKSYSAPIEMVVYCVLLKNGREEWLISDRAEVATNLKAHIMNNARSADDNVRQAIIDKITDMTLDDMLNDKSLRTYTDRYGKEKTLISPSWTMPQSREAMIERKMMNNATKKYPKNFSNAFVRKAFEDTFEDYDQYRETNKPKEIEVVSAEELASEVTPDGEVLPKPQAQVEEVKQSGDMTFEQWKAEQIAKGTTGIKDEIKKEEEPDDLPF